MCSRSFDNRNRLPFHLHPCQHHVRSGLIGKPESYHFPVELNQNRNNMPFTFVGVSKGVSDQEILNHLENFNRGDNHLTDIGYALNIKPGTGYYMPACTLHAPGSLVTYELQVASDVSCIPESRVNDREMPEDLLDRDLPLMVAKDGLNKVAQYILDMINCPDSGNKDNFRLEYYRPPVEIFIMRMVNRSSLYIDVDAVLRNPIQIFTAPNILLSIAINHWNLRKSSFWDYCLTWF